VSWTKSLLNDVLVKTENINPVNEPNRVFQYVDVSSVCKDRLLITEPQNIFGVNAPSRARKLIKTDDVIFATVRPTLRRVAIVPSDFNNEVCSTGYFVMRSNGKVLPRFIFYYLLRTEFINQMEKIQTGASYPAVTDRQVREQIIFYPPLQTQQKIVEKLDAIFAEIDIAMAAAETNAKNADALFQSYLTEVFDRSDDYYITSTLGDYYDVRDGTHDSPKFYDEGYPLITSKNLKNGEINFEKIQHISKEDYLNISQRSAVKKGDVLMAMIGTIGNPVVIDTEAEFAIKNVALFKTTSQQSPHFLRYYLGSDFVIRKMEKDAKGATQKFVGLGYLRSFPIKVPSLDIQIKLVKELEEYEQHTKKLSNLYASRCNQLLSLKQSILQQAFNGELVKD
jgi:type I restriction enzyme S subunit